MESSINPVKGIDLGQLDEITMFILRAFSGLLALNFNIISHDHITLMNFIFIFDNTLSIQIIKQLNFVFFDLRNDLEFILSNHNSVPVHFSGEFNIVSSEINFWDLEL